MARLGRTEGRRPISWALPGIKVFIVPLARKLKGDRTVLAKGLRLKVEDFKQGKKEIVEILDNLSKKSKDLDCEFSYLEEK